MFVSVGGEVITGESVGEFVGRGERVIVKLREGDGETERVGEFVTDRVSDGVLVREVESVTVDVGIGVIVTERVVVRVSAIMIV